MLKPDERNLEGECETGEEGNSGGELRSGQEKRVQPVHSEGEVKLEPRSAYCVDVYVRTNGEMYYVRHLEDGEWGEKDWKTVAAFSQYSAALDYIEKRTGER